MNVLHRNPKETGRAYALRVIKKNIVDLTLQPGTMISENDLAEELALSRTPVREALMELEGVGIIEVYPQKGSRVALIDDVLVDEAHFLRCCLETGVVRLLCSSDCQEGVNELARMIQMQQIYLDSGTNEEIIELDNLFHQKMYSLVDKMHCYEMAQNMGIHFNRIRTLTSQHSNNQRNIQEHLELVDSIRKRDEEKAVQIIKCHLSHYKKDEDDIRALYPNYFQ